MTIVAMGTSLPECSVSVSAAIAQKNELAIANAIGSNIFNLMVVCGVCALFSPLEVQKSTLVKELPFSVAVAALLVVFGLTGMKVGQLEGVALLVVFAAFIFWMVLSAIHARTAQTEEEYKTLPVWKCLLFIIFGVAAIIIGGELVVDSASAIAKTFGMSDNLIGLTIVAFGTSLPELVTSVVAARKNELDMALGNVIGSNIFNILFVLGTAATISPLTVIGENIVDAAVLIGMSALVWCFCWRKKRLVRWQGIVMLVMYVGYVVYIGNR
jgi:cation:H+ antiporter